MKFKIDKKIFESFPDLNIGLILAKNIDNKENNKEIIESIRDQEKRIRENLSIENLTENSKIASWRKAYSSFGAKPKKYHCCAENLTKMALNNIDLKPINKLVDVYTYILIKHMVPLGGDDIDKVDGDITLKYAEGNETFQELNKEEVKNPKPGEIVYADDKEILCRRWNWRECDKSKMTETTKNAALVIEGLPPFTKENIEEISKELAQLIEKYCGGEIQIFIVNKERSEIEM